MTGAVVESRVVVELKSMEKLAPVHSKQVLTSLRLSRQIHHPPRHDLLERWQAWRTGMILWSCVRRFHGVKPPATASGTRDFHRSSPASMRARMSAPVNRNSMSAVASMGMM